MVALQNTAEGGSDTTTVTTGNSGGSSGNAWDTVTIGASAGITFDNDQTYGTLAYKIVGSASGDAFLIWSTSLGTVGELWGRLYLYLTALPAGNINLLRHRLAGSQCARMTIDTAGHVELRQASNSLLVETTAAVATNQWVRIEWHVIAEATNGTFEARLYNSPDSTTATETISSTTAALLDNIDEVQIGQLSIASPSTFWLDNLQLNTSGWAGPSFTTVDQAGETDTADTIIPVLSGLSVAVGQAEETDTAGVTTPLQPITVSVAQASETDTAQTITPLFPVTVAVGQASETDTADTITPAAPAPSVVDEWTTTATDADPIVRVTPVAGNWLITTVSWHTTDGTTPAIAVGDLARNWWRRLGQSPPSAASIGVEIWACPNVSLGGRSYTDVHVTVADVTGSDLGRVGVNVTEVTDLGDHITLEAVDADTADAATAFSLSMSAPSAASLAIVGVVVDDDDTTVSHTSLGWTSLTAVTASSAVEIEQFGRLKATSGAETSSWTSSPAVNFAGVLVAFRQSGVGPDQPNENWPGLQVQLGLGFDMATPLPAVQWTSVMDRMASLRTRHGIQAELGAPQAGEADIELRNNDGALTPRVAAGEGTAAGDGTTTYIVIPDSQATHALGDFAVIKRDGVPIPTVTGDYAVLIEDKPSAFGFTNVTFAPALTGITETGDTIEACPVDMYLPFRTLATWDGKTYPVVTGQVEQLPQETVDAHRVMVSAVGTDALATLQAETVTPLRGEILRRRPWAYWPCDDPSGSPSAQNIATRTTMQLAQQTSKFGAGSASAEFGADTRSNGIHGINGDFGTAWGQSGLVAADTTEGFCLRADLDDPLEVADGVTIFLIAAIEQVELGPTTEPTIFIIKNDDPGGTSTGAMLQLAADQTTGQAQISVWDKDTHARTDTLSGGGNIIDLGPGDFNSLAVTFTRTAWTCYLPHVNTTFSGSCDLATTFSILNVFGEADKFFNGTMTNGSVAHVAVWDRVLSAAEIEELDEAHIWAGSGREFAHERIKRKLATSGWKGARVLTAGDVLLSDDMGFEGRSVADMANEVASYEAGLTFVDAGGYLRFESRLAAAGKAPRVILGEDTAAGEIPWMPGLKYDWDPTFVYNHVSANRSADLWDTDTPQGFANSRTTHIAEDSASRDRYGLRTLPRDVRLYNLQDASALASWLLSKYRSPTLRIESVTIDPSAYPAAWPAVLGTDVADLVTINRRPLGAPETSTECMVLDVRHEISTTTQRWLTTWTLAAADPGTLVLNDDVRGIVGDNGFGW